jgi:hypothetical protein
MPAAVLEPMLGKQASGLSLPANLGPLCLQQFPWLLEAHAPVQVDPRASDTLWAPDDSSLLALLPHGYPQLATLVRSLLPYT